jgi:hypothetical protein
MRIDFDGYCNIWYDALMYKVYYTTGKDLKYSIFYLDKYNKVKDIVLEYGKKVYSHIFFPYKSYDVEDKIIVEEIIKGNKSTALLNIRNVDNCLAKLSQ